MRKIYGIIGGIGSGKDTIAEYLTTQYNFKHESFASGLKDAISAIFGWDRYMLEGSDSDARHTREMVDKWWAERLDMPNLTPRWVLQFFGTDLCRDAFHDEIWIASLENRIKNSTDDIVISDCRFENEVATIRKMGAKIIHVKRGPDPYWKNDAICAGVGDEYAIERLTNLGIHHSEWGRFTIPVDYVFKNDGTIEDLYQRIDKII